MELRLTADGERVELRDPDVLDAFSLGGDHAPAASASAALAATGVRLTDDGSHAFVEPELVRRLAAAQGVDATWTGRFDSMVSYAAAKGWTNDDGWIRAHTVWRD